MILHRELPYYPWMDGRLNRLPGILPMEPGDYLRRDEVFAAQMALRDQLIAQQLDKVHAVLPEARAAAREMLQMVLDRLGYAGASVTRPDGVEVAIDWDQPLITLGRLVQEDICILQDNGTEYCLNGAILCFPASWTLAQKIGRPMMAIHAPVTSYNDDVGARVQRMFSALRPEQGLWRMNHMTYADADLHHPRLENDPRPAPEVRQFLRAERQCLIRLPQSRAVVFTIHSYVIRMSDLPPDARAALG